jgi:hypothetical protein
MSFVNCFVNFRENFAINFFRVSLEFRKLDCVETRETEKTDMI